jgi:hypothetical protein
MPLPASGPIWLSQLRDEFGNWGPPNLLSHYYRGALTSANNTAVPAGGYISLAAFYGAQKSIPGSWSIATPGTYSFVVPAYSTLRIDVRGAGGGGGGSRVMSKTPCAAGKSARRFGSSARRVMSAGPSVRQPTAPPG